MTISTEELFMDLDRSGPIPLYYQIARRMQSAIESGALAPGSRIENEVKLAEHLSISRPTIRRAIQEHELELHYQPIVDCATGETRRLEGLMRWRHPQLGRQAAQTDPDARRDAAGDQGLADGLVDLVVDGRAVGEGFARSCFSHPLLPSAHPRENVDPS